MALVKALTMVFYDGFRRRAGEVFEFNGKIEGNGSIELVTNDEAATRPDIPLTIEQIRERLDGYGVKYAPQTGIKKLQELLAEAEGKIEE